TLAGSVHDLRTAEDPRLFREDHDVIRMVARSIVVSEGRLPRPHADHHPAAEPIRRYGADDTRRDVAVRVRGHGARRRGKPEGDDQHRQRDEHRRRYPHHVLPFLFAATYHLATYIATLCTDAYLKSTGRLSLQGQIVRHRCTKTVTRLALLEAKALLIPFQLHVTLDS